MADINALIATLPDRIQENALRQMQTNLGGQRYQQNALSMGQQLGAQNALRGIYSDPRNIDPTTGLPRLGSVGPLITANPPMGMDFLELESKLQDSRSRANLTNLRASEYSAGLFDQYVVQPLLHYEDSLDPHLSPEQRQQMIAAEKDRLVKDSVAKLGLAPEIQSRWENLQPKPEWRPQSVLWNERQDRIEKEWHTEEEIDPESGLPRKYTWNPAYQGFFALDRKTPLSWTPTGIGKPMGGENKFFTETWTDPATGKPQSATFEQDAYNRKFVPGTREPYRPHPELGGLIVPASAKGQASPQLGGGATYRVPDPDNPGKTKPLFLFPPKRQGDPWLNADQTPYTGSVANISKIEPGSPDAPGTGMTKPAMAYISERERLAEHMTAPGWAGAKYLPGMAENDIRSSLGLPEDAPITVNDARMAALNDVVTRGEIHSNKMALNVISRQNALVQSFEGTALRNANEIDRLGPKATSGGPLLWNRLAVASRREIGIDPQLAALDNAVTDFKNEYVKIMSTSAGQGGMTSDQARIEGDRLFNVKQPWPVMKAALDEARTLMHNRVKSIHDDWDATVKAIHGKGAFPEQLEPTGEGGTFTSEGSVLRKSFPIPENIPKDVPEDRGITGPDGPYVRRGTRLVPAVQRDGKWVPEVEPQGAAGKGPAPRALSTADKSAIDAAISRGENPIIIETQADLNDLPIGSIYEYKGQRRVKHQKGERLE